MANKIQPITELHPDALLLEPREYFDKALVGVLAFPEDHWPRVEPMNVAAYVLKPSKNGSAVQRKMQQNGSTIIRLERGLVKALRHL